MVRHLMLNHFDILNSTGYLEIATKEKKYQKYKIKMRHCRNYIKNKTAKKKTKKKK